MATLHDDKELDRHDLHGAESTADTGNSNDSTDADTKEQGFYDDKGSEQEGDKDAPESSVKRRGIRGALGRAKGSLSGNKNKLKRRILVGLAGLMTVMMPIFFFIAFFTLALKVPHYVANVAAWQFAKNVRVTAASSQNVVSESVGIQGAKDGWLEAARQRYANMKDSTFRNMERLSAGMLVRNLHRQNLLRPVEVPRGGALGKLGFKRVKAITINDRSVLVPDSMYSYTDKYVHPIQSFKNRLTFFKAVDGAVGNYNPHVNTYIRSKATLKIITDQLGDVGFKGIRMASFVGKDKAAATVEAQREVYATAETKVSVPESAPEEIRNASEKVAQETENCLKDDGCAKGTATADGIPPPAADAAEKAFAESTATSILKGVLSVINPVWQAAMPACLVYSGSVFDPNASNNQSDALQREASQLFATDAQVKRGNVNTATVKGGQISTDTPTQEDKDYNVGGDGLDAMGRKLDGNEGNGIIDSNAMLRVKGQHPNTLVTGYGTQQTALGGYGRTTIFDVLFSHGVADPINSVADGVCPYATNIWVGVGVVAANLIAKAGTAYFTAGSGAVAEYGSELAAEAAAQSGMRLFIDTIVKGFTTREGAVSLFSKSGRFGYDFGKKVTRDTVIILGTVYLARLLTFHNSGAFNNGLAMGKIYANAVDNGANQLSNTMCRNAYYGRPLTYAETAQSDQMDIDTRLQTASRQSTYQRYFALRNPDSMLTKFSATTIMSVNRHTPGKLISSMGSLFNPSAFITTIFSGLTSKASAAANVETENYGNVQCGYTKEELNLMQPAAGADASYASPSENAFRLDYAGEERYSEIDDKYGPCFTQKIGTLMSTKNDAGETYIVRTENGDLSNESVCSPQNLGPHNPGFGDLVFRYRLAHLYNDTIHTMYGMQTAGANELGKADAVGGGI